VCIGPEADVSGEDLVVRTPDGELLAVLKGRPTVDWLRYGDRRIWMLFPDPAGDTPGRPWFFIKHDELFAWMKERHGAAPRWNGVWSDPYVSNELARFLQPFVLRPAATTSTQK
jgi:hypothetical protein